MVIHKVKHNLANLFTFMEISQNQQRFALFWKVGFVTLGSPCDSDKLFILLKGFVWATCISNMKIIHKIHNEGF